MAEAAAVSFVVDRLGDLLIEKAKSLRSVSKNIERLQRELIWMQGFLKEADASPHRDNRVIQNLVAEVTDLAYDAEDVIESRAFAGKKSIVRRMFNSCNVAAEIDEFTSRINELGRRLQTYGIIVREAGDRGTQQKLLQPLRRTYSHIAEQHVIGLEEDAETIVTKLIDGSLRSRAVSICGMGGVGKTTLAKEIYHNTRVRSHFKRFAWECVSQQYKIRDVWEGILINLTPPSERKTIESFSKLRDDEIAKELYRLLMEEKCLVVLDDIWTKEAWDCLRVGFPEANTQCKILLTTRNRDVALHVDPNCHIHSPPYLDESQSWELFLRVAIHHRKEGFTFDEDMKELGRKIVNKCHGLPLAIKTMGGNLQTKSSIHDWTMVYNNMVSHLSGIDNGMTELGLISLLALSYHDLPYQLKQCFLHFGLFPEDFIIRTNTIINIWVAEGIIPKGSRGEEPMVEVEDIAYAYLEDLVSRSMIQVEKWTSTGRIKSCRLHDLMRDLCIQEAKKENFFHAKYLEDGNGEESVQATSTNKFRRLALYMKNSSQEPRLNYDKYAQVRSLLVFYINMNEDFINKSHLVAVTGHLKYLRLLYLDGIQDCPKVPEEIGDLIHLRLLDLGSVMINGLPSSLGKLTQLLTLKLDRLSREVDVPNIFVNMHQLRHLYLPPKFSFGNMKLSHLRNLQTLVNLPLKYLKIEYLVGLSRLRKLKLRASNISEFKCLVEMLNALPSTIFNELPSLSVNCYDRGGDAIEITKIAASFPQLHKLTFAGPLVLGLPDVFQIYHRLNKLKLEASKFVEDPLPHLGKHPNLRVLHLCAALERDAIMFPKNSFSCLQSLIFTGEHHLKEWIIEEGALPLLSFLELNYCINLMSIPEGLKFLESLRELQIVAMPTAFIERITKGEDFHKVQHVRVRLQDIGDLWIRQALEFYLHTALYTPYLYTVQKSCKSMQKVVNRCKKVVNRCSVHHKCQKKL